MRVDRFTATTEIISQSNRQPRKTARVNKLNATVPQRKPKQELKVSLYDQVSSMLLALIMMVGFFVTLMFLVWLTTVLIFGRAPIEVEYIEEIAGRGEHAEGYERDLEEPGEEELDELIEPQLEAALEAVTDVLSSQEAKLDALQTDATVSGKGKGKGDSRQSGPGGEGDNIIPRWERWQIKYNTSTINAYADQLDFFKIELGAAGGGLPKVDYAINLRAARPRSRKGSGDEEKRLYFSWKTGKLKAYDKRLLTKANIKTARRVIMQFIPKDLENRMAGMERAKFRKDKGITDITMFKQTVFGVRAAGRGHEFYVISIQDRPKPKR